MAIAEKEAMIVGIDEGEHSLYALNWTLDHFFTPFASDPPFDLFVVYAKPPPSSGLGLAGPVSPPPLLGLRIGLFSTIERLRYMASGEVLALVDADLKKIAARLAGKAREICVSKSVNNVKVEVVEGDARNVLCEAVERHHASVLVVGSHGYGLVKRAILGSVSDHCVHQASCTVMIVKKPKT